MEQKLHIVVVGGQGFATLRDRPQFLLHNKYIFEEKGAEQPSRADALAPALLMQIKQKHPLKQVGALLQYNNLNNRHIL